MIVTRQTLYDTIQNIFAENCPEDIESYTSELYDRLQLSGFSEELCDKCIEITCEALDPNTQCIYTDNNEALFNAELQDIYATWVGRAANVVGSTAMGVGKGLKYLWNRRAYARDMAHGSSIDKKALNQHGVGFFGRVAAGTQAQYRKNKAKGLRNKRANSQDIQKFRDIASGKVTERSQKGFFGRFKDEKGKFMGIGKGGQGFGKWAKENKAQAATAGAIGAAAVGTAGYLAYRAYKKRQQAKQPQGQNVHQQIQPNA